MEDFIFNDLGDNGVLIYSTFIDHKKRLFAAYIDFSKIATEPFDSVKKMALK